MSNNRPPSGSRPPERRPAGQRDRERYDERRPPARNDSRGSSREESRRRLDRYDEFDTRPTARPEPPRDSASRPSGRPQQGQGRPPQGQGRPPQGQGRPPQGQGRPSQPPRRPPQKKKPRRSAMAILLPPILIVLLLVAVLVVVLRSCAGAEGKPKISGELEMVVSPSQTIVVGNEATATITNLPSELEGKVIWSSGDPSILRVSGGKISAQKVGEAIVSASIEGKNLSKTIKVIGTVEDVKSLVIMPASVSLSSGTTQELKYEVEFETDNPPAVAPTWTSSNAAVASVTKDGLVTARDVGTALITATLGNRSAVCQVTVDKNTAAVPAGEEVTPPAGESATDPNASGAGTGTATGAGANAGAGTGTAGAGTAGAGTGNAGTGNTAASTGTGNTNTNTGGTNQSTGNTGGSGNVDSMYLSQNVGFLEVGGGMKLEAGTSPSGSTITWSSSNPAVATVSQDGTVTGVGVGSATITASAGGRTQACDVVVDPVATVPEGTQQ